MKTLISCITPSIRPELLPIVSKCLSRQTFKAFEWFVVAPQKLFIPIDRAIGHEKQPYSFVSEPKSNPGDYYNLNKAWNEGFRGVRTDLIVSIVDGLWFEPDLLERLWQHYEMNPRAIVGGIGHQYDQMENGKPEHLVWRDPRARIDIGSFYETEATEVEWCVASIPTKAMYAIGGMDEEYDKGAALSEKEANLRMQQAGYACHLDQSLEYRAIHHPRLSKEWDEKYKIACELFKKHVHQILNGERKTLEYLEQ